MLEKLNELMDALLKIEQDFKKYKNVRDSRKLLQEIKVEAQRLRNEILKSFKS